MELNKEHINNNKSIVIIGGTNTGKTNLAVYLARQCEHPTKYLLGYPKEIEGFKIISDKDELFRLENCVVIIDEFQRYFTRYGRHKNDSLEEALDFAEHRNIKLILTSPTNQAIDRELESKIKCWVVKRTNIHTLKQGGMCKVALNSIKDPRITSSNLCLENNEFLWYDIESEIGENGIRNFPFMGVKKDWDIVYSPKPKKVQKKVQSNVQENVKEDE